MAQLDIARHRLANQLIADSTLDRPADTVRWLGAVQAQDYLGALWAIGLRTGNSTERDVEQALADRTIVRTWLLRGTLHFVAAADIRWLLDLLAPRAIGAHASRLRELELDDETFSRSTKVITRALADGRRLERRELFQALETAHISTAGQRGIHILQRLAQQGVLCFGPRAGKQHTFVLLDEWVPESKRIERGAALAELAKRYFTGHGPATLQDFVWWSGLSSADARQALELAKPHLVQAALGGQTYWLASSRPAGKAKTRAVYLLPGFDEYLVGYRDRSAVLDPLYSRQTNAGGGMLNPTIVVNGQIVGTWKRTRQKGLVVVTPSWFAPPTRTDTRALAAAAERYGTFLGIPAAVA